MVNTQFEDVFYYFKEEIEEKLSASRNFFVFLQKNIQYVLSATVGRGDSAGIPQG